MYTSMIYYYQSSTSSSTSSSCPNSGASSPIGHSASTPVPFPRLPSSTVGGTASPTSTSLRHSPRSRQLSFASSSTLARPAKLSCDPSKQKSLASASIDMASSPIAAFSPSHSAVNHLRVLMRRGTQSGIDSSSFIEDMGLPPKEPRPRTMSLLALAGIRNTRSPYDIDDDSDDGDEAFWPKRHVPARHVPPRHVPPISVTTSTSSDTAFQPTGLDTHAKVTKIDSTSSIRSREHTGTAEVRYAHRNTLPSLSRPGFISEPPVARSAKSSQRCHKVRASSIENFTDDPGMFLRAKKATEATTVKSIRQECTLNPALAAIERASRLRSRCVCVVCGKIGSDFPRCPRCSVTWCSRDCRMSNAAAGSARHKCNNISVCKPSTANGMAQSICLYV